MGTVEFSQGTLEHLLKHYPHLTKGEANTLLRISKIAKHPTENVFGTSDIMINPQTYELHVQKSVAEEFGVDQEVGLVPDKEGVLYREYL